MLLELHFKLNYYYYNICRYTPSLYADIDASGVKLKR